MDRIRIDDLRFRCIIGVNDHERHAKQDVSVSLCLHLDLHTPARTDNLDDTLDYKALKDQIRDFVQASDFLLIERLAQGIADICLRSPMVERVSVRVEKPGALTLARTVAVEIDRDRNR